MRILSLNITLLLITINSFSQTSNVFDAVDAKMGLKDFNGAMVLIENILEDNKTDSSRIMAYHYLTTLNDLKGDRNQALETIGNAANKYPQDFSLVCRFGKLLVNSGADDLARQVFFDAIKVATNKTDSLRAKEIFLMVLMNRQEYDSVNSFCNKILLEEKEDPFF